MAKRQTRKPENIALGAAIARAREAQGYSQAKLAKEMGVTQQSVGDWETGKTAPIGARLEKLLQLLPKLRDELGRDHRRSQGSADEAPFYALRRKDFESLSDEQKETVRGLLALVDETVRRAGIAPSTALRGRHTPSSKSN